MSKILRFVVDVSHAICASGVLFMGNPILINAHWPQSERDFPSRYCEASSSIHHRLRRRHLTTIIYSSLLCRIIIVSSSDSFSYIPHHHHWFISIIIITMCMIVNLIPYDTHSRQCYISNKGHCGTPIGSQLCIPYCWGRMVSFLLYACNRVKLTPQLVRYTWSPGKHGSMTSPCISLHMM